MSFEQIAGTLIFVAVATVAVAEHFCHGADMFWNLVSELIGACLTGVGAAFYFKRENTRKLDSVLEVLTRLRRGGKLNAQETRAAVACAVQLMPEAYLTRRRVAGPTVSRDCRICGEQSETTGEGTNASCSTCGIPGEAWAEKAQTK